MSTPIPSSRTNAPTDEQQPHARSLGSSYRPHLAGQSIASIAEEAVSQDLLDPAVGQAIQDDGHDTLQSTVPREIALGQHSLAINYRRLSIVAAGPRTFLDAHQVERRVPTEQDQEAAIEEERSLLEDNNLISPRQPRRRGSQASGRSVKRRISVPSFGILRRKSTLLDEESASTATDSGDAPATENTALLASGSSPVPKAPDRGDESPENINKKWEQAVLNGEIETSWQRESRVLVKYSVPLMFTFLLENSLTLTSVFIVGHIGTNELGAVSLGSMTANITGYAVYFGLSTSLDTLCAQAYGSGNKKLVGLYLQRMVYFLWTCTIPIAIIWAAAPQILSIIVPEKDIAEKAGLYLRLLILGAPGFAAFEGGKRYVQAQGRFDVNLYVLLIVAPLNVLLQYVFVWVFDWGFIGCPIAVVLTENLMPLLLFLYVRFFAGLECWPGFSRAALRNWWPMVRLAVPGLIMVMAEMLAFEILVLASARISATHLAAQTILQSLSVLAYQLPFPISIAGSTRVANLIGAGLPDAAKVTARVIFMIGACFGCLNMVLLSSLRQYIPHLFTSEADVILVAANTLPVNAAFQLMDAMAAQCNGVLRGLGKQEIGGYVALLAYYGIAIPVSFGTAFGLHWDLYGLWAGPAMALTVQAALEGLYIYRTSWEKASEEAAKRNAEA